MFDGDFKIFISPVFILDFLAITSAFSNNMISSDAIGVSSIKFDLKSIVLALGMAIFLAIDSALSKTFMLSLLDMS